MRQLHRIVFIAALVLGLWPTTATYAVPPSSSDGRMCLPDHAYATSYNEVTIPDDNSAGVTLGPLSTAGTGSIEDVILAVSVYHPNTADLVFSLQYDADRDGRPDASSPVEMHLARRDLCFGMEAWYCPVELRGTYFFRDGGWSAAGECASFDVFTGLQGGGDWHLSIVDDGPGNIGTVTEWSVYTETSDEDLEARRAYIKEREATCP